MLFLVSLVLVTTQDESLGYVWVTLALLSYAAQLIEMLASETLRLLWTQNTWDDLLSFRSWFHEIKKCRPELKLSYTPKDEQSQTIKEFQQQEMAIKTLKLELESLM